MLSDLRTKTVVEAAVHGAENSGLTCEKVYEYREIAIYKIQFYMFRTKTFKIYYCLNLLLLLIFHWYSS